MDGTANQVLTTDGSGNASWQAAGGVTAGDDIDVTGTQVDIEPTLDFVHTINSAAATFNLNVSGFSGIVNMNRGGGSPTFFHAGGAITESIGIGIETNAANSNYSVFLGYRAGRTNTGSDNIAIGQQALRNNSSGTRNVSIGGYSLNSNVLGRNNVAVGGYAGGFNTGSSNVFLGYTAGQNSGTLSNSLFIDNSGTSSPLIFGTFNTNEVGINWNSATALPNTLSVNGNASKATAGNWLANSDRRLKKNIEYMKSDAMLQRVLDMNGVTYEWNDDKTGIDRPEGIQHGFIAQELEQTWPTKVHKDPQGYLETAYGDYDPMFVEAIKALNNRIETLEKQNAELQKENKELATLKTEVEAIKELLKSEAKK